MSTQESKAALVSVDTEESWCTGIWSLLHSQHSPIPRSDASWQELVRTWEGNPEPLLHQRWVFFLDVDDVMNNCVYKQGHRAFEHSRHELETQQTRRGIENRMESCCTCPWCNQSPSLNKEKQRNLLTLQNGVSICPAHMSKVIQRVST